MRSTPATPSVTSPLATTPLFSRRSTTSSSDPSVVSNSWSATVGRRRGRRVGTLAKKSLLDECIRRPRARQRHPIPGSREHAGFARGACTKPPGSGGGHEEGGVEQGRPFLNWKVRGRAPPRVAGAGRQPIVQIGHGVL